MVWSHPKFLPPPPAPLLKDLACKLFGNFILRGMRSTEDSIQLHVQHAHHQTLVQLKQRPLSSERQQHHSQAEGVVVQVGGCAHAHMRAHVLTNIARSHYSVCFMINL
jgi:hypothetical protein